MIEKIETPLTRMLGIRYPVIMAPMFLVSNAHMVIEAIKSGITGAIPSLNYRTNDELIQAIRTIKNEAKGPLGINLIVNKSNIKLESHLKICVEEKVDFIITSLGSPESVINTCKPKGIKVFCDVIDLNFAKKVEALGADALIAVNNKAGGHLGPLPPEVLIPELVRNCKIPVISAGGVGTGVQLKEKLDLGACGASIGSPFIASVEAPVSQEYKQACVDYGAKDIVVTTKLSGTPCTVINTPYVQKIGTRQNWLEMLLNRNKRLKKYAKMLTFYKGMKALEKAAFSATYQTLWCAGPSIEHVKSIRPVKEIVETLIQEYEAAAVEVSMVNP
jgi:nitronate monooxygenase